jgi:hypothetical protein
MMIQPQLLQIALDPCDVIYTPDWVARDMVEYFKPVGRILEPCCGDGVFLKYLPTDTMWCEIDRGVDFLAWDDQVDWIFGNPPYAQFSAWLDHSMNLANDVCYLIPANKAFNSYSMIKRVMNWGGIVSIRVYGTGAQMKFTIGYAVAAVHYQRGYVGATAITLYVPKIESTQAALV